MSTPDIRDASEARLEPMGEEALAARLRERGTHVVQHRGRYWQETLRGLFEPVHRLARLRSAEATRPHPLCWGYRAALVEGAGANATMPVHLLSDLADYGPQRLSSNRRYHLRRAERSVRVVQVLGPRLLREEGYAVFRSAHARTQSRYRHVDSQAQFLASLQRFLDDPASLLLAGLVDGRLGGYLAGFAVGRTAYLELVDVATEVLSTHMSTGLHFAFIQACRRSAGVEEIAHSPHIPEDAALGVFKVGLGFPVVHVPSRVRLLPLVEPVLRWRKPFAHYRLTGRVSGPTAAQLAVLGAGAPGRGAGAVH